MRLIEMRQKQAKHTALGSFTRSAGQQIRKGREATTQAVLCEDQVDEKRQSTLS
jgi:hypothetical protein